MTFIDYLRGLRGVFAQRGRAALTVLGIAIGAGSIVLLASLMAGGKAALVAANQDATESDIIEVRRDAVPLDQRDKTRRDLSRADAEVLAEHAMLEGAAVESEAARRSEARFEGRTKRVRIVSARPSAPTVYRLALREGRFVDADDIANRRRVCVVGYEIYEELLKAPGSLEGVSIAMEGEVFSVVGVLAHKGMLGNTTGTNIWDRKVLVPETTFDALWSPRRDAERIYVRQGPKAALAEVRGVVRAVIERRHFGVKNFEVDDESQRKEEEIIVTIIELLLLSTGVLAMFVGGINIMNIMLVTVTERTREIGVRRALGATRRSILTQFLLESGAVALGGGLAGILGGVGIGYLASLALRQWATAWSYEVPVAAALVGLCLSLATGLVFGAYPAWRAARTLPIEALRFD